MNTGESVVVQNLTEVGVVWLGRSQVTKRYRLVTKYPITQLIDIDDERLC